MVNNIIMGRPMLDSPSQLLPANRKIMTGKFFIPRRLHLGALHLVLLNEVV